MMNEFFFDISFTLLFINYIISFYYLCIFRFEFLWQIVYTKSVLNELKVYFAI